MTTMTFFRSETLTLVVWIIFVCSVVKSQTLTQKLDLLMRNASVTMVSARIQSMVWVFFQCDRRVVGNFCSSSGHVV